MRLFFIFVASIISFLAYGGNYLNYEVKERESIKSISTKFRLEEQKLLEANNLEVDATIKIGQSLKIPVSYKYYDPIYSNLKEIFNESPSNWRNPLFEVYRWSKSSNVLIFDTIDYSLQSSMFKRLAFYVEKKDYRGGIYTLEELNELKGWNGHDYRSIDLARFFNKIDEDKLRKTTGEDILLDILIRTRIIIKTRRGYISGRGAVLSYSRSSNYRHRKYILQHEAFHGLFFTYSGFRSFATLVWNNMDRDAKEIWKMYLDYLGYDSSDQRLVINEFVAYMLQSTEKEEYDYFMQLIYYRLRRKYPDKKKFVENFYKANPQPFKNEINKLDVFIGKIVIE